MTPNERGFSEAVARASLAVVAAFVVIAARWWHRADLREHHLFRGAPLADLGASLSTRAVFAIATARSRRPRPRGYTAKDPHLGDHVAATTGPAAGAHSMGAPSYAPDVSRTSLAHESVWRELEQ